MTPIADVAFVASVLSLYLDLPDTPLRYNSADQAFARRLQEQQISLPVIEAALLLASLRRSFLTHVLEAPTTVHAGQAALGDQE